MPLTIVTREHMPDSFWMLYFWEKSLQKRNHSVAKFVCASKPFPRDIAGKRFKVLIINACGEKSTNLLASQKLQFATDSENDVKNVGKWWTLMLHENAQFLFQNLQNAWIDSFNWFAFWSLPAFWVFNECVLRIWPRKNAARDIYATPKFWHKIQDSQKSVEYLLNRPRVLLTKTFLQLWDVLKLVYNAHSWP